MEPPVHKTVFIAPKKKKKRVLTGHGKQKNAGCHSATNASIIRRIHSYDVVTRVPDRDDDDDFTGTGSPSSSSFGGPDSRLSLDIDAASSSSPLVASDQTNEATTEVTGRDEITTVAMTDLTETATPIALTTSSSAEPSAAAIIVAPDVEHQSSSGDYLTLTGTIRRGKRDGQSIDITLNMSREELEKMEAQLSTSKSAGSSLFGVGSGVHVFAFSLLVMPFVMIASTCYAFYWGTFTWYNVYLHFSEERGLLHRVLVSPVLVLTFPFWITLVSLAIGVYAAVAQLSWRYDRWRAEVQDLEKGFYGWACAALHLVDCAPYQVVVLNDVPVDSEKINIKSDHAVDVDTTTV